MLSRVARVVNLAAPARTLACCPSAAHGSGSDASHSAAASAATPAARVGSKITAAVARGPKLPFTLEELMLEEPGPGEVLVQVVACGICHTDLVSGGRQLCAPCGTLTCVASANRLSATSTSRRRRRSSLGMKVTTLPA
jgi:hypothetical protein